MAPSALSPSPLPARALSPSTIAEEGSADLPWLIERVANNLGFSALSLAHAGLSSDDLIAVAQALEVNHTLESLDIEGNDLGTRAMLALADAVRANRTLRELNVGAPARAVRASAERAFAKAVCENYSLTVCNIRLADDKLAESIADAVARNNTIYMHRADALPPTPPRTHRTSGKSPAPTLTRRRNKSASSSAAKRPSSPRILPRKPSDQPSLQEIESIVSDMTVSHKSTLAARIAALDDVRLARCVEIIRAATVVNSNEKENSNENGVGGVEDDDEDLEVDLEVLDSSTLWKLVELVDGFSDIDVEHDDESYQDSEDMLSTDDTAVTASPGDVDVLWLVEQLVNNVGIQTLQLQNAVLSTNGIVKIAKALHSNTVLKSLNLDGNVIDDTAMIALIEMIRVNQSLKELSLGTSNGPYAHEIELSLAAAVSENNTLTDLTATIDDAGVSLSIEVSLLRNKASKNNMKQRETSLDLTVSSRIPGAAALLINGEFDAPILLTQTRPKTMDTKTKPIDDFCQRSLELFGPDPPHANFTLRNKQLQISFNFKYASKRVVAKVSNKKTESRTRASSIAQIAHQPQRNRKVDSVLDRSGASTPASSAGITGGDMLLTRQPNNTSRRPSDMRSLHDGGSSDGGDDDSWTSKRMRTPELLQTDYRTWFGKSEYGKRFLEQERQKGKVEKDAAAAGRQDERAKLDGRLLTTYHKLRPRELTDFPETVQVAATMQANAAAKPPLARANINAAIPLPSVLLSTSQPGERSKSIIVCQRSEDEKVGSVREQLGIAKQNKASKLAAARRLNTPAIHELLDTNAENKRQAVHDHLFS
ncbi:hypothetical protein HDU84_004992 [Entophlyctis sp. JEL0112]|nr:hypothetical protein HDU84_004992 [Entophlyctis sp. JEL0112]